MEFKDQMNNTIRLREYPRRIVSLVPSQTQLLYDLGLTDEVVGITKFCIYPEEWFQTKSRIGGTKGIDLEALKKLNPDLIIGNKEENVESDIEKLKEIAPVWMSDIYTLDDALSMITSIGKMVDRELGAISLVNEINENFNSLAKIVEKSKKQSVVYFIWNSPDMVVGTNTFIDDLLKRCGLVNLIEQERYPELPQGISPDLVFLSSEPFPFSEKHQKKFAQKFPKAKIHLVNGEQFSWYGSMLKDAPSYFSDLLKELSGQ